MAWHDITYACGHEGREQIYGPINKREWIADRKAQDLCLECKEKHFEEECAEKNKRAAEAAEEQGLPELAGTKNQVPWAETIRQQFINDFFKVVEEKGVSEKAKYDIVQLYESVLKHTSASWWINNRRREYNAFDIHRMLKREEERLSKDEEDRIIEENIPTENINQAKIEATVRPENPLTETVAEISLIDDYIKVVFPEYNQDFYEIIKKQLKLEWTGSFWKRSLTSRAGDPMHRIAEVGHRLLAEGFIIRIYDETLRKKAIAGEYEEECTKWILTRTTGEYKGWFVLKWGYSDDYYNVSRKIPGSKYDRPNVVVPPEQFEEVLDFAKMYDFRISETTTGTIEEARKAKDKALLVSVDKPVKKEKFVADVIPPVLTIPEEVEIDESLRDDD